jgi:hypothetical protein
MDELGEGTWVVGCKMQSDIDLAVVCVSPVGHKANERCAPMHSRIVGADEYLR